MQPFGVAGYTFRTAGSYLNSKIYEGMAWTEQDHPGSSGGFTLGKCNEGLALVRLLASTFSLIFTSLGNSYT